MPPHIDQHLKGCENKGRLDAEAPAGANRAIAFAALETWFAEQLQPHEVPLRRWLEKRFPSVGDRDDLVQESFVRTLRSHAVNPIANVRGFLFLTARNLALNCLRRRRHERPLGLEEIDPNGVLDESADTPETVARRQEIDLLHQALQSLPERCRQVFVLRRIHGLPQREIAARLGISEKTVENQSVIALDKCAAFFARQDGSKARGEGRSGNAEVRHA